MVTKAKQVEKYNRKYPTYNITGIKNVNSEWLEASNDSNYNCKSLYELYDNPSDAKISSYKDILNTYKPKQIISVRGSGFSYSVLLVAENGDTLHITKLNNYLVQTV